MFGHCSAKHDEKANAKKADKEKKKKKKRRKKKDKKRVMAVKKEPGPAIIAKLHLSDNGIDVFNTSHSNNRASLVSFLQLCKMYVSQSLAAVQSKLISCMLSGVTRVGVTRGGN